MIQQHESPHHTDDILWHETAGWVKFLVDGAPPNIIHIYTYLEKYIGVHIQLEGFWSYHACNGG